MKLIVNQQTLQEFRLLQNLYNTFLFVTSTSCSVRFNHVNSFHCILSDLTVEISFKL